jgi:hypothetical protein
MTTKMLETEMSKRAAKLHTFLTLALREKLVDIVSLDGETRLEFQEMKECITKLKNAFTDNKNFRKIGDYWDVEKMIDNFLDERLDNPWRVVYETRSHFDQLFVMQMKPGEDAFKTASTAYIFEKFHRLPNTISNFRKLCKERKIQSIPRKGVSDEEKKELVNARTRFRNLAEIIYVKLMKRIYDMDETMFLKMQSDGIFPDADSKKTYKELFVF